MFPQLIAGPIVKYRDVSDRLHVYKGRYELKQIEDGMTLFTFGLAKKVLLADAVGTVAGACTGTSTVTTFIESGSGVEAGGRTGLTALTTAVMFLLCMFIAPIAALIPAPATSAALIYVGILMLSGLKKVDWDDILQVIPVALMLIFMPITGSIGHGIGMALISYSVVAAFTGKAKEVSILTYVLSALFLAKFFIIV